MALPALTRQANSTSQSAIRPSRSLTASIARQAASSMVKRSPGHPSATLGRRRAGRGLYQSIPTRVRKHAGRGGEAILRGQPRHAGGHAGVERRQERGDVGALGGGAGGLPPGPPPPPPLAGGAA